MTKKVLFHFLTFVAIIPASAWIWSGKIQTQWIELSIFYIFGIFCPIFFTFRIVRIFVRANYLHQQGIVIENYIPSFTIIGSAGLQRGAYDLGINEKSSDYTICFAGNESLIFYECDADMIKTQINDVFDILNGANRKVGEIKIGSIQKITFSQEESSKFLSWIGDKLTNHYLHLFGIGLILKYKQILPDALIKIYYLDRKWKQRCLIIGIPEKIVNKYSFKWNSIMPHWLEVAENYWSYAEKAYHFVFDENKPKAPQLAKVTAIVLTEIVNDYIKKNSKIQRSLLSPEREISF